MAERTESWLSLRRGKYVYLKAQRAQCALLTMQYSDSIRHLYKKNQ